MNDVNDEIVTNKSLQKIFKEKNHPNAVVTKINFACTICVMHLPWLYHKISHKIDTTTILNESITFRIVRNKRTFAIKY